MTKVLTPKEWFASGRNEKLRAALEQPIMQEALAMLQAHTEPVDTILAPLVKEHGSNASTIIALIHAVQSGERRVLRVLNNLASSQTEKLTETQQPFDHITADYLDKK